MLILAVDTALGKESCAILSGNRIVGFSGGEKEQLQAEKLLEHIENAMIQAETDYSKIDIFAINLGPGSFTGIRIGLAAVSAMAFAAEKKLIGISSLEALAFKIWKKYGTKNISVALDAGRGEAYYQEFIGDKELIPSSEAEMIDLKKIIFAEVGNIQECKVKTLFDARDIGGYANELISTGKADYSRKSPIYIRKPDAKIKI